jgi:hypothetical protein
MQFKSWCAVALMGMASMAVGCNSEEKGGGGGSIHAVLQKKGVSASPLVHAVAYSPPTLTNVTGKADSLAINQGGEDGCSFIAWSANSQDGPIAVAGRTLEDFDLGNPKNWTSVGHGMRDACKGGNIIGGEAYFAYIDLHLQAHSGDEVVRIALGDTGSYQAGDVLVADDNGVFNWIDANSSTLTPDTSARPTDAYQYPAIAAMEIPYKDGEREVIMTKVPIRVDDATKAETVSQDTAKVVFEIDFSSITLDAPNQGSREALAKSLSVPFLDEIRGDPSKHPLAKVTPLTKAQMGTAADPAPTLGNDASTAK